ncbi:MAG: hypothetical protein A2020_14270, partial [Lentisphaerae bacterium GWF2_45_14]
MHIRVRFAPSPTGQVHIGNIRTAIFNWLFARHEKGKFLLRIEDTDLERSTEEAKKTLLECMEWLGLDFDEEIMYQAQQASAHREAAAKLLTEKKAYYAPKSDDGRDTPLLFRIPWDTSAIPFVRETGNAEISVSSETPVNIDITGIKFFTVSKNGKPVENAACLAGFKDLVIYGKNAEKLFELNSEIDVLLNGEKGFRFEGCTRLSFTRREVFYNDIVKGELSKPLDNMKDLVILRGDSTPVFHLANVCDDVAQKITHIIRGDDHVENTYRHILLFNALDYQAPSYAHLPMIVNESGKPYSKRDGDAFVGDFKVKGFLAEALFNYLALLGWSPGDDREKMSKQELAQAFTLERVRSAPSQFDTNKLRNLNSLYISEMTTESFITYVRPFAGKMAEAQSFEKVAVLMQSRTRTFTDAASWGYFFSDELEYNPKDAAKILKTNDIRKALAVFAVKVSEMENFSADTLDSTMRSCEKDHNLGEGHLNKPVRFAATAASGGADILDTL